MIFCQEKGHFEKGVEEMTGIKEKEHETPEEQARRLCRESYAEQMDAQGYNADGNPKEETQELRIMPLICLRCKKYIPLTVPTFREISYTHYSYCEECLRAGLRALRYLEAENEKTRIRREFETPEGMRPLPWETPETPQKIVVNNAVDVLSIQTELLAIREALTEIKKVVKGET
jgi:hypothetical protein